jgi:glycosyltransferase involved in cell wall biosynthesis
MIRFSILMPVYNRAKYVQQAIESVLNQTYTNHELIVIDDGSTDGSTDILKSYGNRIKLIQQKNCGPEVARNAGAAIAQGEYLLLLDSDDFFFPSALARYDRVIREFDSPPLVLGCEVYYYDGEPIPQEPSDSHGFRVFRFKDYFSKTISLSNFNSKLAIKKSVFLEVGGFRNSDAQSFLNDDLYLMLKVGTYGPCFVMQGTYTVAYRQHPGNTIKNVKGIATSMFPIIQAERNGEYPGGRERRMARYAIIGGRTGNWAYRYCWRGGQKKLALRLLWKTAPMIAAAMWIRLSRSLQRPTPSIVLNES